MEPGAPMSSDLFSMGWDASGELRPVDRERLLHVLAISEADRGCGMDQGNVQAQRSKQRWVA